MAISPPNRTPINRAYWAGVRTALERDIVDTIRQFIAHDAFDTAAIRAFAKKIGGLEGALEHLDMVERKADEVAKGC